jgi:L-asparagine oxygenase
LVHHGRVAAAAEADRRAGPGRAWRERRWSAGETEAVARWASGVAGDPYSFEFAAYDAALAALRPALPPCAIEAAQAFADPGAPGALLLRGVPVPADLPPTPRAPYGGIGARVGAEPVLLALASLIGEALSFAAMRGGARVHNIYALPGDAATQKASNAVRLDLHTEMAFQDGAPDALAILCLRAGPAPPATDLADLGVAWRGLDGATRARLAEPAFGFPSSYGADGAVRFAAPLPAAEQTPDGPAWRFDEAARGATPAHDAALAALKRALAASAEAVTLAAGDLLLIDNRRVAHGRAAYAPGYGGGDRWLQRVLIRRAPRA